MLATPLLITFAVKEESAPFQKLIGSRPDLRVLLTGIGQRAAAKKLRNALNGQSPGLVLSCGFAGGLDPALTIGTVVFSADEDLMDTANPPPAAPRDGKQISDARGQFPSREESGVGFVGQNATAQPVLFSPALLAAGARPVRFHCADRIAVTVKEKQTLRQSTGADAVEMESGVIRAVCRECKIPSATVRVISDVAQEDLPLDFNLFLDAEQNLNYAKLALALFKSPAKMSGLFKLQKQTQAAAEKLAQVLAQVLANFPR